jgi:(1->4)-alpha-D-glucan 1-alpha-D-glucosylmutase
MAKGYEDTAFYVYNRLVSLNEVGGRPDKFGTSIEEFHQQNIDRAQHWPHTMLATATHDTKRSEDVRVRINVLSELATDWERQVFAWRDLLADAVAKVDGEAAPSANDQYLFFQSFVGTWPAHHLNEDELSDYRNRLVEYMQKAVKEAKQHSSWINPDHEYDDAMRHFVTAALAGPVESNPFLRAGIPFAEHVAYFGRCNSLAQLILKLMSPGVPDIYQGNEIWDLSLVDPDNRRPVDFVLRRKMLKDLGPLLEDQAIDLPRLIGELFKNSADGRIKLYLLVRSLRFRRQQQALFSNGTYEPLTPDVANAKAVCALRWRHEDQQVVVAACVRSATITKGKAIAPVGAEIWNGTFLPVADSEADQMWRNVLTGERLQMHENGGIVGFWLKDLFSVLPVAMVEIECKTASAN